MESGTAIEEPKAKSEGETKTPAPIKTDASPDNGPPNQSIGHASGQEAGRHKRYKEKKALTCARKEAEVMKYRMKKMAIPELFGAFFLRLFFQRGVGTFGFRASRE